MKTKNIFIMIFPSIILILTSFFCLSNVINYIKFDLKGFFVVFLFSLFPLSFLVQGILCKKSQIDLWIPLSISSIIFLIIIFTYMNSSALIYLFINIASFFIGYKLNHST